MKETEGWLCAETDRKPFASKKKRGVRSVKKGRKSTTHTNIQHSNTSPLTRRPRSPLNELSFELVSKRHKSVTSSHQTHVTSSHQTQVSSFFKKKPRLDKQTERVDSPGGVIDLLDSVRDENALVSTADFSNGSTSWNRETTIITSSTCDKSRTEKEEFNEEALFGLIGDSLIVPSHENHLNDLNHTNYLNDLSDEMVTESQLSPCVLTKVGRNKHYRQSYRKRHLSDLNHLNDLNDLNDSSDEMGTETQLSPCVLTMVRRNKRCRQLYGEQQQQQQRQQRQQQQQQIQRQQGTKPLTTNTTTMNDSRFRDEIFKPSSKDPLSIQYALPSSIYVSGTSRCGDIWNLPPTPDSSCVSSSRDDDDRTSCEESYVLPSSIYTRPAPLVFTEEPEHNWDELPSSIYIRPAPVVFSEEPPEFEEGRRRREELKREMEERNAKYPPREYDNDTSSEESS